MKTYELIREIFNQCSRNQMRDVFVSEIETDDPDEYVKQFLVGNDVSFEKTVSGLPQAAALIFDLNLDGLKERLTFTEIV
jgi:hypothetical protein